jgi:hypothetical protein
MRRLFCALALFFILSCTNESDPAPDIATKVEGKYVYEMVDNALGTPIHYSVNWTISRVSDGKIKVKHKQSEWVDNSAVKGSLEYTFEDVEINDVGKFVIDETVNWSFSDPTAKSHMLMNAQLVGKDVDVTVEETTLKDNDTITAQFLLLGQ